MIVKTGVRFRDREALELAVMCREGFSAPVQHVEALKDRRKAILGDRWTDPRCDGPRVDLKVRVGRRWRIVKASVNWDVVHCPCGSCSPWSGVILTLGQGWSQS